MNVGNQAPMMLGAVMFLKGSQRGQTFQITKASIRIGRQPDGTNDLVLPEGSVSRHHAEIVCDNGNWHISRLTPTNTITVNKQPISQDAPIFDRNVIGLGSDVELLFLSYIPAKVPDPGTAPTIYGPPAQIPPTQQLPSTQPDSNVKKDSSGPFSDPGNSAWQIVGILTGIGGIITTIEIILPTDQLAKTAQFLTAIIVFIACLFVVVRARRKPVVIVHHPVQQIHLIERRARKAFFLYLFTNIFLTIIFVISSILAVVYAIESIFTTNITTHEILNLLSISLIIFILGMIFSFIGLIIQMFKLIRRKFLKVSRIVWTAFVFLALATGIIFLNSYIGKQFGNSNSVLSLIIVFIDLTLLVVILESLIVLLIIGIRTLIIFFNRVLSSKSSISVP